MFRFLKPTFRKILLTPVLLIASGLLGRVIVTMLVSDTFPFALPFPFYLSWGPCQPAQECSEFNLLYLVLDVVIWYVASSFLVERVRKK